MQYLCQGDASAWHEPCRKKLLLLKNLDTGDSVAGVGKQLIIQGGDRMVAVDKWRELEPKFRKEWESKYGSMGMEWPEVREAFQFGWVAGQLPEFSGRRWKDVERDLESHWYRPQLAEELSSWDYIREAVREGFDRARKGVQGLRREAA